MFTQLVFASNLAVDGQKLSQFDEEIRQLEAENTNLRVKIAQESSFTNLYQKAQRLGFQNPSEVINSL